jgi:ABC-2 type transport system ATP-binding protein
MPEGATDELLSVRSVAAGYGTRPVLSGIDFTLGAGGFMGLLGPNGSGKSTLLRAISGQIPVAAGSVHLLGIDLAQKPEAAKRVFGYAVDAPELPATLTGVQYLQLVSSIRGCAANNWSRADLIELLALGKWLQLRIGEYSYGTRMKLSLAAALLGNPPLIILDESLNGLDPVIAWRFKQLLVELVRSGRHAVLLSTHVLETVESLCNSAILLSDGKISARWNSDALHQARQQAGGFEASVMTALGEVTAVGKSMRLT